MLRRAGSNSLSRAAKNDLNFEWRVLVSCLLCLLLLCVGLDLRLGEVAEEDVSRLTTTSIGATPAGGFEKQAPFSQHTWAVLPSKFGGNPRRFGAVVPPAEPTSTPPAPSRPASPAKRAAGSASSGLEPAAPLIAMISTTADTASNILRWVRYHKALGVQCYYLFLTGTAAAPEASTALSQEPGVRIFRPQHDEELKAEQLNSSVWNAGWLKTYLHKPCNHELFVAQSINMDTALQAAVVDNITWVTHIDTDELLYPSGNHSFDLHKALESIPKNMETVVLPNYEGVPETHLVQDPFREVTLFKRNRQHVQTEVYQKYIKKALKGNPGFFFAYANGKSIARVRYDIRPNGAHRFAYKWHKASEMIHSSMAVLHYPYARFQDLRGRRDRCDCLPVEEDAKRCFILEFDRRAFIQSSLLPESELLQWYRDHVVFDNATMVEELCRSGLMQRIHLPQLMLETSARRFDVEI